MTGKTLIKDTEGKDGTKIYYEAIETGEEKDPKLFFLHGIGGDLDAFQYIRYPLAMKGFSSIAMDFRGHGRSGHPRQYSKNKIENLVQDFLFVLETEKIDSVILVGHCYGAVVATLITLKYPEKVSKLVLISSTYTAPWYFRSKIMKMIGNSIFNTLAITSTKPIKPGPSLYPEGKFHKDYEIWGFMKTFFKNSPRNYLLATKEIINIDLKEKLRLIKMPTLIISGEKDSIFETSLSHDINSEISGSVLKTIPSGNHVVVLNNADKIVEDILEFIS